MPNPRGDKSAIGRVYTHEEIVGGPRKTDQAQDPADEIASLRARLAEAEGERDRLRAALDVSNHYFRQMHQLVHAALED